MRIAGRLALLLLLAAAAPALADALSPAECAEREREERAARNVLRAIAGSPESAATWVVPGYLIEVATTTAKPWWAAARPEDPLSGRMSFVVGEGGEVRVGEPPEPGHVYPTRLERLIALLDRAIAAPPGALHEWERVVPVLEEVLAAEDAQERILELVEAERAVHGRRLPVLRSFLLRSFYLQGEKLVESVRDVASLERVREHAKKMVTTDEGFAIPAGDLVRKAEAILHSPDRK